MQVLSELLANYDTHSLCCACPTLKGYVNWAALLQLRDYCQTRRGDNATIGRAGVSNQDGAESWIAGIQIYAVD